MFNLFKKQNTGEEITLSISGMHCTSCALNIDGALEDTKGVLRADTSYAQAKVTVVFDPTVIDEKKIKKIIKDEGYEVC